MRFVKYLSLLMACFLASCSTPTNSSGHGQDKEEGFTVVWTNWDGSVLETDTNVPYGSIPTYDGPTPTRSGTEQYKYVFSGWSPAVEQVTDDIAYVAMFTKAGCSYTITWTNWDNSVLEIDTNVPHGSMPKYDGPTPTKTGAALKYEFAGWSPSVTKAVGDATYKAVFTEYVNSVEMNYSKYHVLKGNNLRIYSSNNRGAELKTNNPSLIQIIDNNNIKALEPGVATVYYLTKNGNKSAESIINIYEVHLPETPYNYTVYGINNLKQSVLYQQATVTNISFEMDSRTGDLFKNQISIKMTLNATKTYCALGGGARSVNFVFRCYDENENNITGDSSIVYSQSFSVGESIVATDYINFNSVGGVITIKPILNYYTNTLIM